MLQMRQLFTSWFLGERTCLATLPQRHFASWRPIKWNRAKFNRLLYHA